GRPIQEFNASSSVARAYQPLSDYGAICDIVLGPGIIGGHADSFATSIGYHLYGPVGVHTERIPPPGATFEWTEEMDFAAVSTTGVLGDATHASPEHGAELWRRCVDDAADLIRRIIRGESVRESWHFKGG
ncbi:MAG: creatininase family protein, partial [Dehalococcoidia bacterium]